MVEEIKCPKCGSETVLRIAKKGPNAGQRFYVCLNYPGCKGKVPASRLSTQQSKQAKVLGRRMKVFWILVSIPLGAIALALMGAIPGALIGLITGIFGVQLYAAIVLAILILITYPRSRRRMGRKTDMLTYFIALCAAAGAGAACYFVGSAID